MTLIWWILGLGLAVLGLKLIVLWAEPHLAFAPRPGATPPPAGFQRINLRTSDGVALSGWQATIPDDGPIFLYFCGNAGNLSDRADLLLRAESHAIHVIAVDYRGTGESQGRATERGVYEDAESLYRYATNSLRIAPERIVLWGHSIGGAVAVHLASERTCGGIILESTFRSAEAMARRMFSIIPAHWLMSYRLDNETLIAKLAIPRLFIHGTDDYSVPSEDSERLFALSPSPGEIWLVNGAGHNDVYEVGGEEFFTRILAFGQRLSSNYPPVRQKVD